MAKGSIMSETPRVEDSEFLVNWSSNEWKTRRDESSFAEFQKTFHFAGTSLEKVESLLGPPAHRTDAWWKYRSPAGGQLTLFIENGVVTRHEIKLATDEELLRFYIKQWKGKKDGRALHWLYNKVRPGMTDDQVQEMFGPPQEISKLNGVIDYYGYVTPDGQNYIFIYWNYRQNRPVVESTCR
jgi:hypothetical protein